MATFGHYVSEETKEKLRIANLGKKKPNYPKNRKKKSKEDCLKISKSLKGRKLTEEHKRKISESEKGKFVSSETKYKISEATKSVWKSKSKDKKEKDILMLIKNSSFKSCDTIIERKVEEQLNKYKIKYFKQKPICNAHFVVDFYLPEYKLVIECNGDYWHSLEKAKIRDKELEEYVISKGKDILWLWEHEIKDCWFDLADYLEVEHG